MQQTYRRPLAGRLAEFDVRPPGVLSGATRLGRPDLLAEVEVIAVDQHRVRPADDRSLRIPR
ncbi:hypothetical protein [Murinocardiopsis flavida]|uniref:hypothetical protein n=1 Tax=Murinocardiopsis flavida TaxID=645275 RepID=UPI000D0CB204|nr:hypothetical protein [Murinocardiopsis flavida]